MVDQANQNSNQNSIQFLEDEEYPNVVIIQFTGDITSQLIATRDENGHSVPEKLEYLLHHQKARSVFIFDFFAAGEIDSATIGLKAITAKQNKIVKLVFQQDSFPHRAFRKLGLLNVLSYFPTLDAALYSKDSKPIFNT